MRRLVRIDIRGIAAKSREIGKWVLPAMLHAFLPVVGRRLVSVSADDDAGDSEVDPDYITTSTS